MAALFFDIDGTLISDQTKEIPESTVKALKKAKDKGHKIFINTGRTICSVPENVKKQEFSGILCGCGTYILYEDQVLFESVIPEELGYQYIELMKRYKVEGFLEGTEDIYFTNRVTNYEPLESTRRYMAAFGLGIERAIEEQGFTYAKILIYTTEQTEKEKFFEEISDTMVSIDRTKGIYECIQKEYSKSTAIEYMRNYLDMTKDDIYVFGDSSNDLTMFEYANHAVAMKVHDPVLDPYTEYITDTVEAGGIYKAMEHYGLI